jgi:hypothetical protein
VYLTGWIASTPAPWAGTPSSDPDCESEQKICEEDGPKPVFFVSKMHLLLDSEGGMAKYPFPGFTA